MVLHPLVMEMKYQCVLYRRGKRMLWEGGRNQLANSSALHWFKILAFLRR